MMRLSRKSLCKVLGGGCFSSFAHHVLAGNAAAIEVEDRLFGQGEFLGGIPRRYPFSLPFLVFFVFRISG